MTVSLEQRVASIEKLLSLMRPFLKGPMHGMSMFENLAERSTDPEDPPEGFGSLWLSDGTGTGDDGDLIFERTAGAVTEQFILNAGPTTYGDYDTNIQTHSTGSYQLSTVSVSVVLDAAGYIMANAQYLLRNSHAAQNAYCAIFQDATQISGTGATSSTSYIQQSLPAASYVAAGTYVISLKYYATANSAYLDNAYLTVLAWEV